MARNNEPPRFEMSVDDGAWEQVRLPSNCLPYHQVLVLGEYTERLENGGSVRYRSARPTRDGSAVE